MQSSRAEQWNTLQELMVKAQAGDQQAYGDFLRQLNKELMGFIEYKIGFLNRTDDIVQETLMSIHKGIHTYNPERPLKSWVLAIAQNRICDFLRKQKRHVEKEIGEHLGYETTAAPAEEESPHPQAPYLTEALGRLNDKYRQAIELTKLEGLSIPEAATKLGVTESTVKMRCHRGYKILRKQLERISDEK